MNDTHKHSFIPTILGADFAYCVGCGSYFKMEREYKDGKKFIYIYEVRLP